MRKADSILSHALFLCLSAKGLSGKAMEATFARNVLPGPQLILVRTRLDKRAMCEQKKNNKRNLLSPVSNFPKRKQIPSMHQQLNP